MEQELQRIKEVALTAIKAATDQQALQDVRVKYLGKKGEVTALLKAWVNYPQRNALRWVLL